MGNYTRIVLIASAVGWMVTALLLAGVVFVSKANAADTRDMHCAPIGVCGIKAWDPAGRYRNPNLGLGSKAGQTLNTAPNINA